MLEIILIVYLAKKMAKTLKEKDYKPGGYVFMFVALWIVGEIIGMIIGSFILPGFGAYIFAILGAASGALLGFGIVNNLSVKTDEKIIDQKL